MTPLLRIAILLLITTSVLGQRTKFRPTIVILYPYEKVTSEEIDKELEQFIVEMEGTEEGKAAFLLDVKDGPENWKRIREMEFEFLNKQDFFTTLTFGCEIYISFKLFEYNPDFLVIPVRDSCDGNLKSLKKMADKYTVDWVLNFPKIKLEKEGAIKRTTVTFQLYSVLADKVVFQKDYTGINKNPGLEFTCENDEDSWHCTLNNLESVALFDILDEINKGKKYWR
jgi:hypothetical protein